MKELTIKEKAKRYDEAIKQGEHILNTPYTTHWDIMKEVVEHIFPSLKESEDEKVRKQILNYFMAKKVNEPQPVLDSWIAWLEKQGGHAWSEEDDLMLNDIITCNERHGYLTAENITWLKSIKERVQRT